ncbi:MAG: hypothetical protein ACRC7W_03320 [Fusobacteriaceae bacterium]
MFKVGDKVYCMIHGEGEVISINEMFMHGVMVQFNHIYMPVSFTEDGRLNEHYPPTLGFTKVEMPKPVQIRLRWRANHNGGYFHVNTMGFINDAIEVGDSIDRNRFKVGNYFKTEQEAKESKFYKVFHEEE